MAEGRTTPTPTASFLLCVSILPISVDHHQLAIIGVAAEVVPFSASTGIMAQEGNLIHLGPVLLVVSRHRIFDALTHNSSSSSVARWSLHVLVVAGEVPQIRVNLNRLVVLLL